VSSGVAGRLARPSYPHSEHMKSLIRSTVSQTLHFVPMSKTLSSPSTNTSKSDTCYLVDIRQIKPVLCMVVNINFCDAEKISPYRSISFVHVPQRFFIYSACPHRRMQLHVLPHAHVPAKPPRAQGAVAATNQTQFTSDSHDSYPAAFSSSALQRTQANRATYSPNNSGRETSMA
jgi:hypothetical protein